jgi:hypothetical protein
MKPTKEKMSKPEFWWCVKASGKYLFGTMSRTRKEAKDVYLWTYFQTQLPLWCSVVRIRVEEVR